jgi:hypothetical protein
MFKKLYNLRLKGIYILSVSKTDGQYTLINLLEKFDYQKYLKWAKKVVEVTQGLEEMTEAIKVKSIII